METDEVKDEVKDEEEDEDEDGNKEDDDEAEKSVGGGEDVCFGGSLAV